MNSEPNTDIKPKDFFQKFGLYEFLRYFLSGIVFLWGFQVLYINLDKYDLKREGIYALLLGVIIYCVHRNLVYPCIEFCFANKHGFRDYPDFKIGLWTNPKKYLVYQRTEWSSQIHFLFCLFWSLLISTIIFCIKTKCCKNQSIINLVLAFIFLISALRGNLLQFQILEKLKKKPDDKPEK